jgi:anti-sigma factor RsiW
MTDGSDSLERRFSRYLDGECTAGEHQRLKSLLRADPRARASFEQYRSLDRQVGDALRMALGRWPQTVPKRTLWARVGRGLAVAAAACLAAMAWLHPAQRTTNPGPTRPAQAASIGSWFAPAAPQGDAVEALPSAYERPELRVRGTEREWIVIPGQEPGSYLVIEVDRVRTHVIGVHRDF